MIYTARRRPTRPNSRRPRWERLENRFVLSAILATDPSAGETLARSPTALHVSFGQPLADFSLGFNDVILDRVAADGTLTPVFDDSTAPFEQLDDDGTGLTFTLDVALEPGHYRLVLSGGSTITGLDGTWLSPLDGNDEPLADFTIRSPGVTLADAIDLGTIGPAISSVAGTLDFASNPSDVKLYKFTVPGGQSYRLGAEVDSVRDGGALNTALTLFDAQGRVLAADDVGRHDAAADPFLFAGLNPGTYYLGVSGTGDLPGQPGGYDVIAGTPGPAQTQAGGAFTLRLVADAADAPAALVDFRVQHADPLDSTPTGFSMRFSAPLDLGDSGASVFDRATGGLRVTDQSGRSWPIAAVNYDEVHAAISYLFMDRLPQGVYTVRLADANPLSDLAGHAVISPSMRGGAIATFAVAPDLRAREADGSLPLAGASPQSEDLGPLAPNLVLNGITRTLTIAPGDAVEFRVVSLYTDYYRLTLRHDGGPLRVDVVLGDGTAYGVDPGPDGLENAQFAKIQAGVHVLRLAATGDQPVTLTLTLSIGAFSWDSLLANGLGQGSALNLRLVSIDAPASFSTADPAPSPGQALRIADNILIASAPALGPQGNVAFGATTTIVGTVVASHAGPSTSPSADGTLGQSGLSLDLGGALIGLPGADADHVAAVGPAGESGAVALAEAGTGLGQSIYTASLRGEFRSFGESPSDPAPAPVPPGPILDGSLPTEVAPSPSSPPVLAGAEEPASIAERAATSPEVVASGEVVAASTPQVRGASPAVPASSTDPGDEPSPSEGVTSWVIGLAGLAALAVRPILRRLKSRRRAKTTARVVPAPHVVSARVRV